MSTETGKMRILVSDKLTDEGLKILEADGEFEVVNDPDITPERLKAEIGGFDGLAIRSGTSVTREVLENSGKLKVIGRAGVGLDNVDIAAATERGIVVMNTPEGNTISTAEHSVSMMLSLARRIPGADATMKNGEWAKKNFTGTELYGKTLGVIGLGRIGREVAARMKGFQMKVMGYDPFVNESAATKLGIELASVDDICKHADVITVHTPLNKDTRGIINAERLKMMKPTTLLVNCARGGIIDEDALLDALKNNTIAGAALDVFETEPLPADHPFRSLSNAVITPHLAASTTEAQENVTRDVAEQIVEVLRGGMIRNAVNAPSLDPVELERMQPVIDLVGRLGRFMAQFCSKPAKKLSIEYSGTATEYDVSHLTKGVVRGFLAPLGSETVNFVNALHLAQSKGIEVTESTSSDSHDFSGLISVSTECSEGNKTTISGTLYQSRFPRLVMINDYRFDIMPEGNMLLIANVDTPGFIGAFGSKLGDHKINVADMSLARGEGGDAITILKTDSEVPDEVVKELEALDQVRWVKAITV